MRLVPTLILVAAITAAATAAAAPRLELRVDAAAERVEATLFGESPAGPLYLRDLDRERRVPATDIVAIEGGIVATFDLRTLSPDGKDHALALEGDRGELARASIVLPAPPEESALRWLVIVGPLLGLLMIAAAVFIGRRVVTGRLRGREPR